jgi:hypothetical protein
VNKRAKERRREAGPENERIRMESLRHQAGAGRLRGVKLNDRRV